LSMGELDRLPAAKNLLEIMQQSGQGQKGRRAFIKCLFTKGLRQNNIDI